MVVDTFVIPEGRTTVWRTEPISNEGAMDLPGMFERALTLIPPRNIIEPIVLGNAHADGFISDGFKWTWHSKRTLTGLQYRLTEITNSLAYADFSRRRQVFPIRQSMRDSRYLP